MNVVTQQFLLKNPNLRAAWADKLVYIYSGERSTYWRAKGAGYTSRISEAGIYDFQDAWVRTAHCGPEKYIEYEEVTR